MNPLLSVPACFESWCVLCVPEQAPEVDWKAIADPAERRRQRRLAKNRVTAARSRERKKAQWAELEEKLFALEVRPPACLPAL